MVPEAGSSKCIPLRQRADSVKSVIRNRLLTAKCLYETIRAHGNQVTCPCCGWSFKAFGSVGSRSNASCPRCGSMERHRLRWHYLAREGLPQPGSSVLHMAPERATYTWLRKRKDITYVRGDIRESALTTHVFDLTDSPFDDDSFDLILISHVLEHIPDDRRAMREICRMLKPSGIAVLQHPIEVDRQITYEDPHITSHVDREREFGQFDHVRAYGQDFADRLTEAGLDVQIPNLLESIPLEVATRFGLLRSDEIPFDGETVYICRPSAEERNNTRSGLSRQDTPRLPVQTLPEVHISATGS